MEIGSASEAPVTADIAPNPGARAAHATHVGHAAHLAATAPVAKDEVAVSAAGTQLSSLGAAASGDFDSKKVDAIRQAIREGRFTVNPDAIAGKLIDDATRLLGAQVN